MVWIPQFKLYNSAGTVLLYTFSAVNFTNAPQSVKDTVEITNLRSRGAIEIPGGEKPWDLEMRFTILGDDYEDIASQIDTLETTIELQIPYLLRIDKSSSSYYEYPVKRLQPIFYNEGLRNDWVEMRIIFRANCW